MSFPPFFPHGHLRCTRGDWKSLFLSHVLFPLRAYLFFWAEFSPRGHLKGEWKSIFPSHTYPLTGIFILLREMENIPPELFSPRGHLYYTRGEWKSISLTGTSVPPKGGLEEHYHPSGAPLLPERGRDKALPASHLRLNAARNHIARARARLESCSGFAAAPPLSNRAAIPERRRRDTRLRAEGSASWSQPLGGESGRQAGREGGRGERCGAAALAEARWPRRSGGQGWGTELVPRWRWRSGRTSGAGSGGAPGVTRGERSLRGAASAGEGRGWGAGWRVAVVLLSGVVV